MLSRVGWFLIFLVINTPDHFYLGALVLPLEISDGDDGRTNSAHCSRVLCVVIVRGSRRLFPVGTRWSVLIASLNSLRRLESPPAKSTDVESELTQHLSQVNLFQGE